MADARFARGPKPRRVAGLAGPLFYAEGNCGMGLGAWDWRPDPRIVSTILESLGLERPAHRLEGRSLLDLLHGRQLEWRDTVFSELDWSFKIARQRLGYRVDQCYAWSLRNERWRYVYWLDAPEQLYDLSVDPEQFVDLGREASHAVPRQVLRDELFDWLARRKRRKRRTTMTHAQIEAPTGAHKRAGVFYGQW